MRKILAILLFFYVFSIFSFAQEEKTKNVPWYLTGPRDYSWSPYAPSVFDPGYLNEYNRWQQYNNSIYRPRLEPIVIQQPRSPLGAFLDGVGTGLVQSFDYYYRKEQQEEDIEGIVKFAELLQKKRESIPKPPLGYIRDIPSLPPGAVLDRQNQDLESYMQSVGAIRAKENYEDRSTEELIGTGLIKGTIDIRWLREALDDDPKFPLKDLRTENPLTFKPDLNRYELYCRVMALEKFLREKGLWNEYKEFRDSLFKRIREKQREK